MGSVLILDAEYENMDHAVAQIFASFHLPESDVLIKPNLLGGFAVKTHVTTHPSVVKALVKYCEQEDIKIVVGDNPAGRGDPGVKAQKAGLYQASEGHFEDISESRKIPVESEYFSTLVVSKKVLDAGYIINVPKFKTHIQTIITGAIKNMFGMLPGEEKSIIHCKARSLHDFSQALVDIYQIRPPDLTVMDAVVGMEGNGPSTGTPRYIGKILASDNGVELDAVMAHMMGLDPQKVPMLQYAYQKGLGEISVDNIAITAKGELNKIPQFKVPSKTLVSLITPLSSRYYDFLAIKPHLNLEKCVKCWECVEKCPVSAIGRNEYPAIDRGKCVSCFCCVEVCENQAMELPSRARDLFDRFFLRM